MVSNSNNKEDSLKKRYFYKIITQLSSIFFNLIAAGIVPRTLGPVNYGNFTFLTNFFTQIQNFLNMGTSIGFYNKLSQRQDDFGLVSIYFRFIGFIFIIIFSFTLISDITGLHTKIFPNQKVMFIYLALIWGFFSYLRDIFNKMMDGYGYTVSAEKYRFFCFNGDDRNSCFDLF